MSIIRIVKRKLVIAGIVIGAILILGILRKDEDTWICDQSQWVKHGQPAFEKPIVACDRKILLPKNEEDCLAAGGVWEKIGIDPRESCNIKTRDRGNLCTDSSQCEGMCQVELTKEEMGRGMRGKLKINKQYGQCSVWVVELGCRGIMKQGEAQVICFD